MEENIRNRIFDIKDESGFASLSLEIFNYQYGNNPVYRSFVDCLGKDPGNVRNIRDIPFMPVEFFRDHTVITGEIRVEMIFESSGTAGVITSKHFITDLKLYEESFLRGFRLFYGDPDKYIIAALLPPYTERAGSSLVYMADRLIKETNHKLSGFYRDDITDFIQKSRKVRNRGRKAMIIGVSFALLGLAEKSAPDLSGFIVMETGGMKGRRKEITRERAIVYQRLILITPRAGSDSITYQ
jgi:phenylacetate-coenzyme A ligase PaaK-like adenylate-forming protein